ncbi:MAG TPA: aminoglycoside adenylyltransferase domain-containing protein [Micromonosporaceae bacterium]|nr:aminoglycoside adenylyltransferase domain-containing protein [Micromonosporaceae bacterium]
MTAPDEVVSYVRRLARLLNALRSDVVGVYLHGSAVLGGFDPARSDVDVLAVVAGSDPESQRDTGAALAATGPFCPGTGLEASVITAATAADVGDCPFEVHVGTADGTLVTGAGHHGDPDLVLHVAVCRQHALAVTGRPPREVFGPVPPGRIRAALGDELRWGRDHGSGAYAVLNACRALRYAAEGVLCSKLDGAAWYLAAHPGDAAATAAVAAQRGSGAGPEPREVAGFVAAALDRIDG